MPFEGAGSGNDTASAQGRVLPLAGGLIPVTDELPERPVIC